MPTPLNAETGTQVRVHNWFSPGHIRTPAYLRGAVGTVERVLGPFPNPEDLAYRRAPRHLALYRVRFDAVTLWPDATPGDTVEAEIYAHWLTEV